MQRVLEDILDALRAGKELDDAHLSSILHAHNRRRVLEMRAQGAQEQNRRARDYARNKAKFPRAMRLKYFIEKIFDRFEHVITAYLTRRLFGVSICAISLTLTSTGT